MIHLRRRQLTLLAVGVFGLLAIWLWLFAREPAYQGESLTIWVIKLKQGTQAENAQAQAAISHMGRAAVSHLTRTIQQKDSSLKKKLLTYAPKYPVVKYFIRRTKQQNRAYAASALGEIGPAARRALPALEALSREDNPLTSPAAKAAIMKIKGEPLAPLVQALSDLTLTNWAETAHLVAEFGTNASSAVPALCRALASGRYDLRETTLYALGCIHSDPITVMPELRRAADRDPKGYAIWALGRFESEAWTAIPLLKSKLTHSDRGVRRQVYEALFRIMSPYEYESLVPFLREELTNSDADLRLTARFYLSRIAPQEVAKFDAKQ